MDIPRASGPRRREASPPGLWKPRAPRPAPAAIGAPGGTCNPTAAAPSAPPRAGSPVPVHFAGRPASPTEEKLRALQAMDGAEAEALGLYPTRAAGAPISLSPSEAAAARDFAADMRKVDGDGALRKQGEFIRGYARGADGRSAVPTGPLRYFPGFSSQLPVGELSPEAFLVIHSHPDHPLATAYPSRGDYLEANREGKLHADYRELLYVPGADRFFRFDGRSYPPTFAETRFPE